METQLVVIGKDENGCWKECEEQFGDKARNNVIRVPYIKNAQLKYIYPIADVFVLPSIQEIFGMVLLEAMYFGAPTISSGSAGARTLIENGKSGYIIENFDPENWALKITELLKNEHLRSKIGKAASERIQEQFMWSCIVEKMIEEIV